MKAPQLSSHNSQPPSHSNPQNGFNLHTAFAGNSQNNYNSFHHNPYVGYVPHYNGQQPMYGNQNMHNNHHHHFNSAPHNANGMNPLNMGINQNTGYPSNQHPYQPNNGYQGFSLNNKQ